MFSQACVILFRIGLMATRSLLIFVMRRSLRILLECFLVTACKLSLGQGNVFTGVCQLFCSGGSLCMMSLPVWLIGPMFLPGVSVSGPMFVPGGGGLCPSGLCQRKAGGTHPTGMHFVVPNSVNIVRYSRSFVCRTRISFSAKQDPLSPLV